MNWALVFATLALSALTWMLAVWFVERRLADHENRIEALEIKTGLRSRVSEKEKT